MIIFKYVKEFLTSTSMKGVPRIIKSPNICLRGMWFIAVITSLGICMLQANSLVASYWKYPKITSITEHYINMAHGSIPPTEVMICNLNPIASNSNRVVDDEHSLESFITKVINITVCDGCSDTDYTYWMGIRRKLRSTIGYFEYLGKTKIGRLGQSQESFIVDCKAMRVSGVEKDYFPCHSYVTIHEVITQYLFKCFLLRFTNKAFTAPIYGISVVLYLDNYDLEWHKYFSYSSDFLQRKGVMVDILSPGDPPLGSRRSMFFPPGTFTDIRMYYERRTRLGPPYGDCCSEVSKDLYVNKTWAGHAVNYSEQSCVSLCVEKLLLQTCGCIDAYGIIIMDHTETLGYPYCGDVKLGAVVFKAFLQCVKQNIRSLSAQCSKQCPRRCYGTYHHAVTSSSRWPIDPIPQQFYQQYIAGKPYEFRFNRELFNDSNMANRYGILDTATYQVTSNFLRIDSYFSENEILDMKDEVKITWAALLSQLGGTLNLWSGITVIVIVELLELIITCVTTMFTSFRHAQVEDITTNVYNIDIIQQSKDDSIPIHNNTNSIKKE